MNNDQAAEVLEQAADLLESEKIGWCQNQYIGRWGQKINACAVGAILLVTGMPVETYCMGGNEVDDLTSIISLAVLNDEDVEHWNDKYGRTKEEVIDLFRDSAKKFRNGELNIT